MTTHVGKWLRFFGNKCSIAEVILLFQWLGAVSKRILDERYQNWIDDSFNPNWIQLFWKAIIWREALFHLSKFCDSSLSWVNVLRFLGRPSWNQTSCLFFFLVFIKIRLYANVSFYLGQQWSKCAPIFWRVTIRATKVVSGEGRGGNISHRDEKVSHSFVFLYGHVSLRTLFSENKWDSFRWKRERNMVWCIKMWFYVLLQTEWKLAVLGCRGGGVLIE